MKITKRLRFYVTKLITGKKTNPNTMKRVLVFLAICAGIFFFNPVFANRQHDIVTNDRPAIIENSSPQTSVILPEKAHQKTFSLNALFRGMLGMASLILLGFLLSSD